MKRKLVPSQIFTRLKAHSKGVAVSTGTGTSLTQSDLMTCTVADPFDRCTADLPIYTSSCVVQKMCACAHSGRIRSQSMIRYSRQNCCTARAYRLLQRRMHASTTIEIFSVLLLGAFYKSDQFINCAAQIINSYNAQQFINGARVLAAQLSTMEQANMEYYLFQINC